MREFFRNLGVVEGQNVVDEVRGAEKRLVGKIGRQIEMFQRSKCSKSENDNDGNSARGSVRHLSSTSYEFVFIPCVYNVGRDEL